MLSKHLGAEFINKWKKLSAVINLYMLVGATSTAIVNSYSSIWWGIDFCFNHSGDCIFFLGSLMIKLRGDELHCAAKCREG